MRPLAAKRSSPLKTAGRRNVFFGGREIPLPVYLRNTLAAGDRFDGPCLIDQEDTTTFVTPGWSGKVDEFGIVHLSTAGQSSQLGRDGK